MKRCSKYVKQGVELRYFVNVSIYSCFEISPNILYDCQGHFFLRKTMPFALDGASAFGTKAKMKHQSIYWLAYAAVQTPHKLFSLLVGSSIIHLVNVC